MKNILARIWCFIVGHNFIDLYTLDNADIFDGRWRSKWGVHKCMRCGKEENWQYDREY